MVNLFLADETTGQVAERGECTRSASDTPGHFTGHFTGSTVAVPPHNPSCMTWELRYGRVRHLVTLVVSY